MNKIEDIIYSVLTMIAATVFVLYVINRNHPTADPAQIVESQVIELTRIDN